MKTGSFERALQPIVLTAIAVVIGLAIGVATNFVAMLIYAVMLGIPLFLLWMAKDTPSLEDRIAVLDAARDARKRAVRAPPAPVTSKAA